MAKHFLQETLQSLDEVSQKHKYIKAFVGLDGYIDLIQRAVKVRKSSGPEYFETITDFSLHLQKAAGKSGQVELVTQEKKLEDYMKNWHREIEVL